MNTEKTNTEDDENIPLLQDVVQPNELEKATDEESIGIDLIPAAHQTLEMIREQVTTQLNTELHPIISTAINSAVDQAIKDIRQVLLDELRSTLENRIQSLIWDAVNKTK